MYGDTRPTQRHYPRLRHHWCVANADLVEAYWRQYQLSQSQDPVDLAMADSLFHVWEEVEEAAQFGKPEVVDLLVALADAAPNDLALATLGAGPVEDLIHVLTETNRHAGRADILREQIDRAVGDSDTIALGRFNQGTAFWAAHRAKIEDAALAVQHAARPGGPGPNTKD